MRGKRFVRIIVMTMLFGLGMLPASGLLPAWADEGYGHGKGYGGKHGGAYGGYGMSGHHSTTGHLLRGLLMSQKEFGLTDEQVAKLKALQLDLDKARIKAEADILIAEREAQALIDDEKTELSAIEEKVKQAEMMEVGLRMAAVKARRDAMALLTPEQSARVKAVHEKMMQQYKERKMEQEKDHGMMKKGAGHPAKKGDEKKGMAP